MATATARIGDVRYATTITTGRHALTADEPERNGGADVGPRRSTCCWRPWAPARP
jgi:putative redox protein